MINNFAKFFTANNVGDTVEVSEINGEVLYIPAAVDGTLRSVKGQAGATSKLQVSTAGVKSTGTLATDGVFTLETDGSTLRSVGTVPTRTDSTAGNGTSAIDSTSTDVAGRITFSNTWANTDTCEVTFNTAYTTAPKVILSYSSSVKAGITLTSTTKFTITATGTCSGFVDYMVVESK